MLPDILKIKGIHPGIILRRELKRNHRKATEFSSKIGEHSQTLNAIMKEKRRITPALSIKLGEELEVSPEYFLVLQAFYDIQKTQNLNDDDKPNINILRKSLFWDTDISKINWVKMKNAVIRRVFERGNDEERREIERFYGKAYVQCVLSQETTSPMTLNTPNI
ncbi:helix-turn-helix transcriptional regulator [Chryseobacterium fistulae]|uniref:Antitoxin HigA n=1 Tax=Chryseobacterium fistulae TaxID=2675058 RepID=A0A6N4XXJ6_9FLAO|nr:helix-turn-helix domain-containing protein [Chryseobacterium fistulae]CAA7392503.1 Antitoxin HigA [Chryseobacterium fistulae]